jgi:hypothetical protein
MAALTAGAEFSLSTKSPAKIRNLSRQGQRCLRERAIILLVDDRQQ